MAWAIFGSLVGLGISFVIPNLGRFYAVLGGGLGGGLGALSFIIFTLLFGDAAGRFIGLPIVGFSLGYAIGQVEEASRVAWLQVAYGNSREVVRISLGHELVCVGSSSRHCAVWAQGARPIALRFRYIDGQVLCDDMAVEKTFPVEDGFQQQVGNVLIQVGYGGQSTVQNSSGTSQAGVAAAPRPPAPPPTLHKPLVKSAPIRSQDPLGQATAGKARASQTSQSKQPPPPPPPPPK